MKIGIPYLRVTLPDEYSGVQLFNGFYDKRNVKNGKRQMFLYGFNNHKYVILYAFYLNMTVNTYLNRFYTKITDRHTKFYRN